MGKVYANSLCTLAATEGSDSSASIFVQRDLVVGAPFTVRQPFQDCTIDWTIIPDWIHLTKYHCELYTRAWVVQERFLSRRILHLSSFPFYECTCCLQNEACSRAWTATRSLKGPFEFAHFPTQERDWLSKDMHTEPRSAVERWWDIVKLYTRCSLTYDHDKMIAIGGMARAFHEITGLDYYAGIWGGQHLELSLLWIRHPRLARLERPVRYRGMHCFHFISLFATLQDTTGVCVSWCSAYISTLQLRHGPGHPLMDQYIQTHIHVFDVPPSSSLRRISIQSRDMTCLATLPMARCFCEDSSWRYATLWDERKPYKAT